jgi:hypothetical protein
VRTGQVHVECQQAGGVAGSRFTTPENYRHKARSHANEKRKGRNSSQFRVAARLASQNPVAAGLVTSIQEGHWIKARNKDLEITHEAFQRIKTNQENRPTTPQGWVAI